MRDQTTVSDARAVRSLLQELLRVTNQAIIQAEFARRSELFPGAADEIGARFLQLLPAAEEAGVLNLQLAVQQVEEQLPATDVLLLCVDALDGYVCTDEGCLREPELDDPGPDCDCRWCTGMRALAVAEPFLPPADLDGDTVVELSEKGRALVAEWQAACAVEPEELAALAAPAVMH